MAAHIFFAIVLWCVTWFRHLIPYPVRAATVIAFFYLIGVVGIARFGLTAGGIPFLIICAPLATILFNWRWGIGLALIVVLSFGTIGWLSVNGVIRSGIDIAAYGMSPSTWVTYLFSMLLAVGALVAAVASSNRSMYTALIEENKTGEQLNKLAKSLEIRIAERTLELENSNRQFKTITDASPNIIAITNMSDGRITFANPAVYDIAGYREEELIGKIAPDYFDNPEDQEKYTEQLRLHGSVSGFETCLRKADGSKFDANISGRIVELDGEPHVVAEVADITGFNKAAKELVDARDEAEQANQAKSEFLSSMSHELRTPMNAILGFAQMLEFNPKESLTKEQKNCVDHILKGGQHLLGLIDQVLDLARIESGKLQLTIEPVLPSDLFRECLEMLRPAADKRGIELSGEKKSVQLINTDPARFKQVLINLLSNAIKYNVDKGSVKFGCLDKEGDIVRIFITDTGSGIAREEQAGLFEPFNRLGKEASEIEGTGVGLTVSKQLVEAMGGHIGFESEVGKGSTFWVDFPAIKNTPAKQTGQIEIPKTDQQPKQKNFAATVLYIEDNPANLQLMETIIDRMDGISLISAHNAELGMSMAEEHQPGLILMDINLPGMDGIAAMKVLSQQEETKDIPVIALSAAAMKNDIERGMAAGFKGYLSKPFKVQEIIETIEKELTT